MTSEQIGHPTTGSLHSSSVRTMFFRQTPAAHTVIERRRSHTRLFFTFNSTRTSCLGRSSQARDTPRMDIYIRHTLSKTSSMARQPPSPVAWSNQLNELSGKQHHHNCHLRFHAHILTSIAITAQYLCATGCHPRLLRLSHRNDILLTTFPPSSRVHLLNASTAPSARIRALTLQLHVNARYLRSRKITRSVRFACR